MQIVHKTAKCPICGCIYLPDAYHCPKCGTYSVGDKNRNGDTIPLMHTAITEMRDLPEPQVAHHYTIHIDMIERDKTIIIMKNQEIPYLRNEEYETYYRDNRGLYIC